MSLRARWETLKFRVLGADRYFTRVPKRERMTADLACEKNADLAEALDDVLKADARNHVAKLNSGDVAVRRKQWRDRYNARRPEGTKEIL